MTEDTPQHPVPAPSAPPASPASRREDLAWWGVWLGVVLAAVGLVAGIVMAAKKKVVTCPNGKYFADGETDFNCYAHPQGALGIAIAAISVMLGILIVFAGIVAISTLRGQETVDEGGSEST